ncbi:hypothetical protein BTVI_92976 [Pitangus sulphuratus]|nr:hypothetical protein BTVI_92976 [Pitangus sulphuratus]
MEGLFVWRLKGAGTRHIPCHFVHLCRAANDRLITFQYFNFLKRMYVTQYNKDLSQRAKPKSDPVVSPFHELQQLDQEKKVIHKISPVSPVHQPWPETSGRNELREVKSPAESEASGTAARAEPREDRQWKEMKLRLDELPGILARLSKIKLTALVVSTASAGFAMAPVPFDLPCFLLASLGTGLASCAANSINQNALKISTVWSSFRDNVPVPELPFMGQQCLWSLMLISALLHSSWEGKLLLGSSYTPKESSSSEQVTTLVMNRVTKRSSHSHSQFSNCAFIRAGTGDGHGLGVKTEEIPVIILKHQCDGQELWAVEIYVDAPNRDMTIPCNFREYHKGAGI